MAKNSNKKFKNNQQPTMVLFIRHGENEWTKSHKLAGRTPGVHLNEQGKKQANALSKRLAGVKLDAIYASPLERTVETANVIARPHNLMVQKHPGLLEANYGDWTGKAVSKLAKQKSWHTIQFYPSGASFPGGETMYQRQARMVQEVNNLVATHPGQTIALVGHADLIKSAVAHYLGVHFDLFQRIVISTASITTVSFSTVGPRVISVNDTNHNPPPEEKGKKKTK
jgi:probable phosphoglycerate mutase